MFLNTFLREGVHGFHMILKGVHCIEKARTPGLKGAGIAQSV
jgi:hypothetical protein